MDMDSSAGKSRLSDVARDAYEFFFPMLMGYRYLFASFLVPELPSHRAPLNTLGGEPQTLTPRFREVISPNADTPYSMAALDLRVEPMVLSVPAVSDRFYHFQLEDLWGHNVHYVGVRATGTGPGRYLLVGPRWEGGTPDGVSGVLRFETDIVFVIGRTQLLGVDDVETLGRIMAAYDLQPWSAFSDQAPAPAPRFDWPRWDDDKSRDEGFIGYANALLPLCRPFHPDDVPHLERFAEIGIEAGAPFDVDSLDRSTREAIRVGVAEARAAIEERIGSLGRSVNGWAVTEAFGNRAWYRGDHLLRAAGAMIGWGGNDATEALYPLARVDSHGHALTGGRRYRVSLPTPPPARAFWSLTMYDTSYDGTAGYLVENPIDRYLINSRTEGLVFGADGSLTIPLQHEAPADPGARANWLPAPAGPFYVIMRLYLPDPAALDGTWDPPPIVAVD